MGKKERLKMTNDNPGETPGIPVVDIAVERMRQENEGLKAENVALKAALDAVTKERNQAASFLEQNERGIAIEDLQKMGCTYSVEHFDKMSLDQLAQLKENYKYYKPAAFKSGADVSGKKEDIYSTLDDLYVPPEART